MTFHELKEFIENKMKLSHIYQPFLIKNLIESGGKSTVRQLAVNFLAHDESQIHYYEKRLMGKPLEVLGKKHGVIKKEGDLVSLAVDKLTLQQKAELSKLCEQKLQEHIERYGLGIWDYRMLEENPVSDSIRFKVLKQANGRCALCGVSKNERPIDVDHIQPRSKKGSNDFHNLQALCSKCNRSKGNQDNTDFRSYGMDEAEPGCLFCQKLHSDEVLLQNDHAFIVADGFPVSAGHSLIIPKRHFADYFKASVVENNAFFELIKMRKDQLLEQDNSIEGFNVGINSGEVAGQTIFHCHVHLIPRRKGDTENPRGGVRGVIPSKMHY